MREIASFYLLLFGFGFAVLTFWDPISTAINEAVGEIGVPATGLILAALIIGYYLSKDKS